MCVHVGVCGGGWGRGGGGQHGSQSSLEDGEAASWQARSSQVQCQSVKQGADPAGAHSLCQKQVSEAGPGVLSFSWVPISGTEGAGGGGGEGEKEYEAEWAVCERSSWIGVSCHAGVLALCFERGTGEKSCLKVTPTSFKIKAGLWRPDSDDSQL